MSITLRRNYKIIIALALLISGLLYFGGTRLISYNFGKGKDINTISTVDYTNDVYLFDETKVHEINIDMADGDYDMMINTYKETGEKEFFHADVTIDGVLVQNVGIRLKGNLTLRQTLGGSMGGDGGDRGERPEGAENQNGDRRMPPGFDMENMDEEEMQEMQARFARMRPPGFDTATSTATSTEGMQMPFGGGGMNGEGNGNNPPFLLKFDEFVDGQTYQGFAEVAVRIGSDQSLLSEPVAFSIHDELGQIVPETSYAYVSSADQDSSLYVICEHIDDRYVARHFPDTDGVLYKAGNFTGFEYLGEDPSLYAEKFEQKTSVNDDDLYYLIEFMKFVTESSDEEFAAGLGDWLELHSFIRMMALDNLLGNNDSFVGMGSNYYLYFNKDTEQFTMLAWDMNLAMGGMGGGGNRGGWQNEEIDEEKQKIMDEWLAEGGFEEGDFENQDDRRQGGMNGPGGRGGSNLLKERFFANEEFSEMYNEEFESLKKIIFAPYQNLTPDEGGENNVAIDGLISSSNDSFGTGFTDGLAAGIANSLAQTFTDFNVGDKVMAQSEYDSGVEKMMSFIRSGGEMSSSTMMGR